ncbi:hypothetical protein SAMN05421863_100212 [Nitrosomonas communis]|uniref:Uncharacterized protein n=1 Tax=Nitrosomonas communis TaxID=44574 RepID=A0A1I4JDD0_9PROT|nr:hypothetical protein SAMN05421863_100212 [Nitrosomonas communis]
MKRSYGLHKRMYAGLFSCFGCILRRCYQLVFHSSFDSHSIKVGSKHFDEVIDITTNIAITADADTRRTGFKQMTGVNCAQMFIAVRVESHFC